MSQFRKELSLIPVPAWIVASLLCVAVVVGAGAILLNNTSDTWPFWMLGMLPVAAIFATYVLLIGYVYGDARRRGMRYGVWTLLAIFIPNAIGIILYFLLRDPLQRPCPSCGGACKGGAAFCPHCGAAVGRNCPQCKWPVEEGWRNCAHCGVQV